jgi:hypothetical protein
VPLSNDILLTEAFSTHPLFSGRVFQERRKEGKKGKRSLTEGKEKIVNRSHGQQRRTQYTPWQPS